MVSFRIPFYIENGILRETVSLIKAADDLRCRNLFVITLDYEKEEKMNKQKVVFKPLWKWLIGM